jgi:hypothetical protein
MMASEDPCIVDKRIDRLAISGEEIDKMHGFGRITAARQQPFTVAQEMPEPG